MPEIAAELIKKIRAAAQSAGVQTQFLPAETHGAQPSKLRPVAPTHIIAIGVSTGGPNALQYLFSKLPVEFSGSILVVQHMPEGFTELFAKRLDESCPIRVKEAQSGDLLVAGRALICPGNRHMKAAIERGYVMRITDLQDLPSIFLAQCAPDRSRGDTTDVKRATSAGSN
jgi:two-component system chemotaxis response regulator CheB